MISMSLWIISVIVIVVTGIVLTDWGSKPGPKWYRVLVLPAGLGLFFWMCKIITSE